MNANTPVAAPEDSIDIGMITVALKARILSSGLKLTDEAAKKVQYDFIGGVIVGIVSTGQKVPMAVYDLLGKSLI